MPIKKFKSFEEAEQDLWCFSPDIEYYNRIDKLFKMAANLYKVKYPSGVFKYKSFAEAQQQLMNWKIENKDIPLKSPL